MQPPPKQIHAEGLTKIFDDFIAVDGVNLDVNSGEVVVLLGPNGAGKTTTVRMLTSVLTPTRGSAQIAGYDVRTQPEHVRASVGVLTEHHGLYNRMNAWEYLDFYGQLYGLHASQCRQKAATLMQSLGLEDPGKKRLGEFSKGMRQKLALIRALLHDPPVLLLDEPTSAMDPESALMVRASIRMLRSAERAIVLCTHNLAEAEELADTVVIMQRGRIIKAGTIDELKRQLFGKEEFQVNLAGPIPAVLPELPPGIVLLDRGIDWLRYQVDDPYSQNPGLVRILSVHDFSIISVQPVPRQLEQVYMDAVQGAGHAY